MKAEDVMKALELCIASRPKCKDCPYFIGGIRCKHSKLLRDAIALLREKDAEIERLRKAVDAWEGKAEEARAENVKLTEENESLIAEVSVKKKLLDRCVDLEDRARANTVIEIKALFAIHYGTYTGKDMTPITEVFWLLDKIEKEMVDGTSDET